MIVITNIMTGTSHLHPVHVGLCYHLRVPWKSGAAFRDGRWRFDDKIERLCLRCEEMLGRRLEWLLEVVEETEVMLPLETLARMERVMHPVIEVADAS